MTVHLRAAVGHRCSQVHRAIALEEKGRFAPALEKFEAVMAVYRQAGRRRPKLQQRAEECRRKMEAQGSAGAAVAGPHDDVMVRARSRREASRAEESAVAATAAATAIQSAFRGTKERKKVQRAVSRYLQLRAAAHR